MANQSHGASVSLVEKSFQESLKKFQTRLTRSELQKFQFTTWNDLKLSIAQIQSDQAARFQAQNLARLGRFLEGFNQFGQITEVFLNVSPFVAFIWGPMKFLLQTAANFSDALDTLLDAYEQLGEVLPLVKDFHALFADNNLMQDAVGRIYDDILEFHRRALRFFTHRTWELVFRSVWTSFKYRFRHILQDLQRHKDLIESQASILHFEQYQRDRKDSHAQFKTLELADQKRRYTEVLRWASVADSILDHESVCEVRNEFPDSGSWLLRNSIYSSWRQDTLPHKSIFWLNGIPGAGKTVLASVLIEDCKKDTGAKSIYFYCKHGDSQKSTCASALRTLLFQLLSHDHDLLPWIYDQYLSSGQVSLRSSDLCRQLLETVLLGEKKVYLIVDGIDEFEPKEAKSLLKSLSTVINVCNHQDRGKVRAVLVSQEWSHIRESLPSFSEISMSTSDNENDIHHYAGVWSKKIMDKFELPVEDKDHLRFLVCERANGMFLFAKLVMHNLYHQVNIEQLRKQIQPTMFPHGLDQAYERIVDRIKQRSPEEQSLGQLLLGWMTCAKRPLKWHEIQGATAIDFKDNDVKFMDRKPYIHIQDICGSLITKLPGDRLELVHTTAKHYLTQTRLVQPPIIECHLTALCLKYLTLDCFDTEMSNDELQSCVENGDFAFQDYAAVHWIDHLNAVVKNVPDRLLDESQDVTHLLEAAVIEFAARYQLFPRADGQAMEASTVCMPFHRLDFSADFQCILSLVQQQKALGTQALDEICPKSLKSAIFANRSVLEGLNQTVLNDSILQKKLHTFYGTKWFKCPRASCFYFHEGFVDKKSSTAHNLRHEKPFRCTFPDCETGHRLGFPTAKELEKHILIHHPELRNTKPTFSKLEIPKLKNNAGKQPSQLSKNTKHAASFACNLCPRTFTRASILRSHQLVHQGVRPFSCNLCPKQFVRDNDLKRHLSLHVVEPKYSCSGMCGIPPKPWGCGKGFLRQDALKNHHKSDKGKSCIAPLLEAQNQQQSQLELQQEQAATSNSNGESSQAISQRYPGLNNAQWSELVMDQKFGKPVFDIAAVLGTTAEFCIYTQVPNRFLDLTLVDLTEQDIRQIQALEGSISIQTEQAQQEQAADAMLVPSLDDYRREGALAYCKPSDALP